MLRVFGCGSVLFDVSRRLLKIFLYVFQRATQIRRHPFTDASDSSSDDDHHNQQSLTINNSSRKNSSTSGVTSSSDHITTAAFHNRRNGSPGGSRAIKRGKVAMFYILISRGFGRKFKLISVR